MRSSLLKRLVDLMGAAVLLVLSAPVMLGTALLIRITLGRPVLFCQRRAGHFGKPFTLIKFRTMREACGSDGRPLPDMERLTRLGWFLRTTSLDELPQLFNVLKGDMSLVGPRPLLEHYLSRYTPEQARRLSVKPGLTGWAQVKGRNALSWEEKFALDLWYVDHGSLPVDAWILLRTVWGILRGDGVNHACSTTMPEFLGSGQGGGTGKAKRRPSQAPSANPADGQQLQVSHAGSTTPIPLTQLTPKPTSTKEGTS